MPLRVKSVLRDAFKIIITNQSKGINEYLRFSEIVWYHEFNRNGGSYIKVNDPTDLEKAYRIWMRNAKTETVNK